MNRKQSDLATVILVQTLIQDLVNIGMSFTRISMRLGLSPSTIQKIVRQDRIPRVKTLMDISQYYLKIFSSPQNYGEWVLTYCNQHQKRILDNMTNTKYLLTRLEMAI